MNELGYDEHINLWQLPDDGNAVFGRNDASEVVRMGVLRSELTKLNPKVSLEVLNRYR